MIGIIVDCIHSDSVEPQLFEVGDITLANFDVGNWIGNIGGTTRLIVNASNVKASITREESCAWSVTVGF
jgi:hypothetical protein